MSRLATAGLIEELDRRRKIEALDAYLTELEREFGPIPTDEQAAAVVWVDQAIAPAVAARTGPRRGRSA